jgi:hypothetical protein
VATGLQHVSPSQADALSNGTMSEKNMFPNGVMVDINWKNHTGEQSGAVLSRLKVNWGLK